MTSAFSWQNSFSLCPASFCIPRPNLPVTPGIDLDYCDIECFTLETNRDHSVVFEIASKYCISDSFVDHDDYSISYKGFLSTVEDIMVI